MRNAFGVLERRQCGESWENSWTHGSIPLINSWSQHVFTKNRQHGRCCSGHPDTVTAGTGKERSPGARRLTAATATCPWQDMRFAALPAGVANRCSRNPLWGDEPVICLLCCVSPSPHCTHTSFRGFKNHPRSAWQGGLDGFVYQKGLLHNKWKSTFLNQTTLVIFFILFIAQGSCNQNVSTLTQTTGSGCVPSSSAMAGPGAFLGREEQCPHQRLNQ